MRPAVLLWSAFTGIGIAGTIIPMYVIIRGPFLGGPLLEPMELFAAIVAFVVGFSVFAGSGAKLYNARSTSDVGEPDILRNGPN